MVSSTIFATGVADSAEAEPTAGLPVTLAANRSAVASVGKRRMLSNGPIWLSFPYLSSCLASRIGVDSLNLSFKGLLLSRKSLRGIQKLNPGQSQLFISIEMALIVVQQTGS